MTTAVQAYKALSAFRILSNEGSHQGSQIGTYVGLGVSQRRMDAKQGRPGRKISVRDVTLGSCTSASSRSGHTVTVSMSNTCSIVPPPSLAVGPHVLEWLFWRSETMTEQTVNLSCSSIARPAAASLVFTQLKNLSNKQKPDVADNPFLSL